VPQHHSRRCSRGVERPRACSSASPWSHNLTRRPVSTIRKHSIKAISHNVLSRHSTSDEFRSLHLWTLGHSSTILSFNMTTSTTRTIDAAAILNSIWAKNALRRESGLPLWPVRETFIHELGQARWRVHVEANYAATRTRVLGELRERHGPGFPNSVSGRWVVEARTSQALRASFLRLRIRRPGCMLR
jgi:hypothetical protein